jgi:hypothetical protein
LEPITPYLLPEPVHSELLALATEADLLILGEMHGVQEMSRLTLGLLPDLEALGYGALGMEIPSELRLPLLDWLHGRSKDPTYFFQPSRDNDGRNSIQAVSLLHQMLAREAGWRLICFDKERPGPDWTWAERDGWMARNLSEQWAQLCPGRKVIAICGNYHSRLAPGAVAPPDLWPAFAAQFQEANPARKVVSIKALFHSGAFHNFGVKPMHVIPDMPTTALIRPFRLDSQDTDAMIPELRPSLDGSHTIELHLPFATPSTFFQEDILSA